MSPAAKKIIQDALALPELDRRRLAERLLDSIPFEAAAEIEQAWIEEVCRRAGALERGEVEAVDGEAAVRDLEAKLRAIHGG